MLAHLVSGSRAAHRAAWLAWLLCVIAACPGCEKKNKITNPGPPPPTLEQVWPNDDGRSWTYRAISRAWDPPAMVYYPDVAHVPPVTFDTVAAVLRARPTGINVMADTSAFQFRFNGTSAIAITVSNPEGVPVQVLEVTHSAPPVKAPLAESFYRQLLARIAIARPDLRARIASRIGASRLDATPLEPTFIHGGLWRRVAQWIGTHPPTDADTIPSWKFLEADLTPGHGFSMQLVPELATDVTLNARVVRWLTVQTPGGAVANAVQVNYYVDYGTSDVRDDTGGFLGVVHGFSCGSVTYAPGVGPVRDDERELLFTGASQRPSGGDLLLELTSTSP